ncbi:hypothetical protein GUJ93_ZPchr0012g21872 [Zizania palustris]|uniref:Uncharacterized protein n=1 Tax=Zizania palustris TaxID=103762 RepID=A0A8J6BTS3_ZIZPA|nr:hypothetical protein GUJ93_ZPchr0012g21872 [Zizania palustris]
MVIVTDQNAGSNIGSALQRQRQVVNQITGIKCSFHSSKLWWQPSRVAGSSSKSGISSLVYLDFGKLLPRTNGIKWPYTVADAELWYQTSR